MRNGRILRGPAPALGARAEDDLRYIRQTMERAGAFTAVPGRGGVLMGVVALGAAGAAALQTTEAAWLAVWTAGAVLAIGVGFAATLRKARLAGVSLVEGPGAKFLLGLCPTLVAGAAMTGLLWAHGLVPALPGTWLLLYGAAVTAGGALSVRPVPLMGLTFMLLGAAALSLPAHFGDPLMAVGFGGLHLAFGAVIWRRHGG